MKTNDSVVIHNWSRSGLGVKELMETCGREVEERVKDTVAKRDKNQRQLQQLSRLRTCLKITKPGESSAGSIGK